MSLSWSWSAIVSVRALRRQPCPRPEPLTPLPSKYRHLIGSHADHPGEGKGVGAIRRGRAREAAHVALARRHSALVTLLVHSRASPHLRRDCGHAPHFAVFLVLPGPSA